VHPEGGKGELVAGKESRRYVTSNITLIACHPSYSIRRAIVLKDQARLDVVLTELVLPDEDGTEFPREADAEVPVLVLNIVRDCGHREEPRLPRSGDGDGAAEALNKDAPIERIVASIKELATTSLLRPPQGRPFSENLARTNRGLRRNRRETFRPRDRP
jgi:DNA-binding NarL/FixJ family response regulator